MDYGIRAPQARQQYVCVGWPALAAAFWRTKNNIRAPSLGGACLRFKLRKHYGAKKLLAQNSILVADNCESCFHNYKKLMASSAPPGNGVTATRNMSTGGCGGELLWAQMLDAWCPK